METTTYIKCCDTIYHRAGSLNKQHIFVVFLSILAFSFIDTSTASQIGQPATITNSGNITYHVLEPSIPPTPDIIVPDDYSTPQAAVNVASDGAKILIRAGTYAPFSLNEKRLIIWGETPTNPGPPSFSDSSTIIDGNLGTIYASLGETALIDATYADGSEIRYLTLKNNPDSHGAGIVASYANNLVIEYVNIYDTGGRGISWRQSTPVCYGNIIMGCHLKNNGYNEGWTGGGRGISLARTSAEISYNWVEDSGEVGIGSSHFATGVYPSGTRIHHNLVERANGPGIHGGGYKQIVEYNIVRDCCQTRGTNSGVDYSISQIYCGMKDSECATRWNIIDHFHWIPPIDTDGFVGYNSIAGYLGYNVVVNPMGKAYSHWDVSAVVIEENYVVSSDGVWSNALGGSHTAGPWELPDVPWNWNGF
jgi:hypothetical protein